jgi:hypothetical protein
MADSVRERILKNRETALKAINGQAPYVGSPAPKSVRRVQVPPQRETGLPLIMLPEPAENFEFPLSEFAYGPVPTRMSHWVHYYTRQDERDTGTELSDAIQDILRAWMADVSCDDNAQLTRPLRLEPVAVADRPSIVGVRILFETLFRWRLTDPTEVM